MIRIDIDDREVHRALTSLQARLGEVDPRIRGGECWTSGRYCRRW